VDSTISRLRRTLVQWVTPRHSHGHDDGATRSQLADFKRALDHAAIVAITDVSGRISCVNDTFCEISGYSREELLGQDHRIVNSGYLAQQAALARVGQLAAVVAHEVRNPLAGIKGAVQILISRRSPGDSELSVMRDIVGRIDSLGDLINHLMLYARPRPPRLRPIHLRALVGEAVTIVRRDPVAQSFEIVVEGDEVSATWSSTPLKPWAAMDG